MLPSVKKRLGFWSLQVLCSVFCFFLALSFSFLLSYKVSFFAGIIDMFVRRVSSQINQIMQLQKSFFDVQKGSKTEEKASLVRDRFNLHKIIIVVTKSGKVLAIDNVSKEILWAHFLKNVDPFISNGELKSPIFMQRTSRHFPYPAQCTVLLRDKETQNGVLFTFNPVTGEPLDEVQRFDYKIIQVMMLPAQNQQNFLSGLLLLDEKYNVHIYPETEQAIAKKLYKSLFFFVAYPDVGDVVGLGFNSTGTKIATFDLLWNIKCNGKILKIVGKNPIERVHSQGRVLADRSVLYKYLNPNLVVILSQSFDDAGKSALNLFFVDSVTGHIVHYDTHPRATEPVNLIHSENWVTMFYHNEKGRRTEVVSYEFHEGPTQANSTAFSSMTSRLFKPMIDSRAYVLATSSIQTAKETITEKGITSKHILVALGTGGIFEIPWMILDPRRPYTVTQEMREEGVIPYTPEIPVPTESIINYNQTLHRIRGIYTVPSGLESTSLVFVYGLDLYYTRVSPSNTFDVLKDDFDYYLIEIVIIGLIITAWVTRHLAYQKALHQAWK